MDSLVPSRQGIVALQMESPKSDSESLALELDSSCMYHALDEYDFEEEEVEVKHDPGVFIYPQKFVDRMLKGEEHRLPQSHVDEVKETLEETIREFGVVFPEKSVHEALAELGVTEDEDDWFPMLKFENGCNDVTVMPEPEKTIPPNKVTLNGSYEFENGWTDVKVLPEPEKTIPPNKVTLKGSYEFENGWTDVKVLPEPEKTIPPSNVTLKGSYEFEYRSTDVLMAVPKRKMSPNKVTLTSVDELENGCTDVKIFPIRTMSPNKVTWMDSYEFENRCTDVKGLPEEKISRDSCQVYDFTLKDLLEARFKKSPKKSCPLSPNKVTLKGLCELENGCTDAMVVPKRTMTPNKGTWKGLYELENRCTDVMVIPKRKISRDTRQLYDFTLKDLLKTKFNKSPKRPCPISPNKVTLKGLLCLQNYTKTRKRPSSKPKSSKNSKMNSNEQAGPVQYYSYEFIIREGLKKRGGEKNIKPYECPVPGCDKSYKNANGMKYHARYGHSPRQEFPCGFEDCKKIYTTKHGLNAHRKSHVGCDESKNINKDAPPKRLKLLKPVESSIFNSPVKQFPVGLGQIPFREIKSYSFACTPEKESEMCYKPKYVIGNLGDRGLGPMM